MGSHMFQSETGDAVSPSVIVFKSLFWLLSLEELHFTRAVVVP